MDESSRVALIMGASRGIGAAAAGAFLQAGYDVALAARSVDTCRDLARQFDETGARARAYAADVADHAQADAVLQAVGRDFGRLDVVVNNAGVITPIADLGAAEPADWAQSIAINLIGAFHVIRAALPGLRARRGVLINVSSGAASTVLEGWSAYCAGKAGLAMLTRSVALEEGDAGVRAFGFRPGVVDTDMQVAIRASGVNRVSKLRREDLAPPEEPARFMVWLASGAADDLAGEEIDIRQPELRARAGLPPLE